jgi:predicted aspartyl protease
MGRFRFPIEIGDTSGERFEELRPWVDTGALYTQVPTSILESLGHTPSGRRRLRLADGSIIERPIGEVPVRIGGEVLHTLCVFGEDDSEPLLGAVTLEQFSLAPDPVNETLVPVVALLL